MAVFGFKAHASTSPEGRAAKNRGSSDKTVSSSRDGEFGFGAFASTRKRLRIGYNPESFSTKSAFVGINPLSWMESLRDEICLMAGYGEKDLISSEAVG